MNRLFKTVFTTMALILCLAMSVSAAANTDWNKGTIRVVGTGISNPNIAVSANHAKALAKRAAVLDAYRQLAEEVNGVHVDSETTVENLMISNDLIKTNVHALIQGAKIVDVQYHGSETCEVTVEMRMFGETDSLAATVLPKNDNIVPFATPAPSVSTPVPQPNPVENNQPKHTSGHGYTGVIIDCIDLGLTPAMSPVIKSESGVPIYGYKNLNYKFVIKHGMADYAKNLAMAERAGSNPLIVKAIRTENHGFNPVVSEADANLILTENLSTHFLDRTNVVFLR